MNKDVTRPMPPSSPFEIASNQLTFVRERNMQLAKLVDLVKKENKQYRDFLDSLIDEFSFDVDCGCVVNKIEDFYLKIQGGKK